MPGNANLKEELEKKVQDGKIEVLTIEKRDWLDSQCKAYENNIKITGLIYDIKDYYKRNASSRREWRADIIQRAFVDTKVVAEDVLFAKNGNGKRELRRIVRDAHPLGNKNGATIVVAFTESWLANDIKETVRKGGAHLEMTKTRRGRQTETIKLHSHIPVILECVRNEALRERRSRITSGSGKRYVVNESLKHPWITLYEIDGDSRRAIQFSVEDGRLADPARTLAIYSLQGGEFKPFRMLTEDEKKDIPQNILTTSPSEVMDQ